MRKTNTNLKRVKFFKKILVLLIIQILIVLAFLYALKPDRPVNFEDLNKTTIIVDDVNYDYHIFTGSVFTVYSDGKEYEFAKFSIAGTDEYSMIELYETINEGDSLIIEYKETKNSKTILSAVLNGKVLRSVDGYNDFLTTQNRLRTISFIAVEVIFLTVSVFIVLIYGSEIKLATIKKVKQFKARGG